MNLFADQTITGFSTLTSSRNDVRKPWFGCGILLGLLAAGLCGCAASTGHVKLAYSPKPDSNSPLSSAKPVAYSLVVLDDRPSNQRDRVGIKINGFGSEANFESDKEATVVIHDALQAQLEHDGHRLVATNSGLAAINITVTLKKMWSEPKAHFWDVEMIGTVDGNVAMSNPTNRAVLFSKTIAGSYHEGHQFIGEGTYEATLNSALAEFVRNFAYDPGVLKALEQAGKPPAADKPGQ